MFLQSVLTSESTVFFYLYFHRKKALENKAVWSKHFSFLSLLFFQCSEISQQKVFWKVGVLNFFPRNSWQAPANNFLFSHCYKLESYTFTAKVIKITNSYQMFQSDPQLATMQSYYFKKHHFFQCSLSTHFCRLHCWLHYSASLWINRLRSISAHTLKFASLVY